jgi:non-ribosomal peptide synthase protein (TIGR01720 family)
LRIGNETTGSAHDPSSQRANVIDINGGIAGGKLDLEFSYSINLLETYSVERFADLYFENLRQLIDHCLSPQAGGFTASDFPLAGIDQNQLDKLISKVSKK